MSCEIGASFCISLSLFSSYALTLDRRTAQRSYGALAVSLAWISTTRWCAWLGGAGAHSGATKLLYPTSYHPLVITLPVASVNARLSRRRQDWLTTSPRRASTCSVLFHSLPRILRHSTRAFRTVNFRTTYPSAVLTGRTNQSRKTRQATMSLWREHLPPTVQQPPRAFREPRQ